MENSLGYCTNCNQFTDFKKILNKSIYYALTCLLCTCDEDRHCALIWYIDNQLKNKKNMETMTNLPDPT